MTREDADAEEDGEREGIESAGGTNGESRAPGEVLEDRRSPR